MIIEALKRSEASRISLPGTSKSVPNTQQVSGQNAIVHQALQVHSVASASKALAPFDDLTVEVLSPQDRVAQLEGENYRLQRLVTELLVKNQQLREGS